MKNLFLRKDPDIGRELRQEEKGMTQDEMAGWHHQLNGHEFEQAPGVGDRRLMCGSPGLWGGRESDTTQRLNSL